MYTNHVLFHGSHLWYGCVHIYLELHFFCVKLKEKKNQEYKMNYLHIK